jgi:uncharacterized protein YnzC (UPF0291/DUF896 family)
MGDVRLKRTPKGKRPDYFADPATDKLMNIVLALAGELSVTRDRLDALERLLDRQGTLEREEVEHFTPGEADVVEREASRQAYIERVLHIVQAQLDEISGKDMPRSEDDILKHMT